MIPSYPFGFDYGNAETCGYLIENQMKRSKVLPSAIAPGSFFDLIKRSATGNVYDRDVDMLRSGEYVIEIGESEYFIGDLAYEKAVVATGRGSTSRYASSKSLATLLTVSGDMISSPEYELFLVTGLPVETFVYKENKEKVRQALEGEHTFTLNRRKRRAIIHVIRVVMEGAGAMIAYGSDKPVLQGVIDIGEHTTDLYLAEGQKVVSEKCRGERLGVGAIVDRLKLRFNTSFKRELKPKEAHDILRAYLGQGSYPLLSARGSEISETILSMWMENIVKDVANDIVSFISTVWSSDSGEVATDIAPLLLIGGGAYYFSKFIRERIPHATLPLRPETANAEGYTTLANILMARSRAIA